MEFAIFLVWLVTQGAGPIAFLIIEYLPKVVAWLAFVERLAPFWKRVLAYGLSAVLAVGGYLLQIVMLYETAPTDWRGWVAKLFTIATVAFGLATLLHGLTLSTKPKLAQRGLPAARPARAVKRP